MRQPTRLRSRSRARRLRLPPRGVAGGLLALVLTGCAARAAPGSGYGGPDQPSGAATARSDESSRRGYAVLEVENQNFWDVRLFVVRDGLPVPIGTVLAMERRRFPLPAGVAGGSADLRVRAVAVPSRLTYTTPPLLLHRGARVELEIRGHLPLSTVTVR